MLQCGHHRYLRYTHRNSGVRVGWGTLINLPLCLTVLGPAFETKSLRESTHELPRFIGRERRPCPSGIRLARERRRRFQDAGCPLHPVHTRLPKETVLRCHAVISPWGPDKVRTARVLV